METTFRFILILLLFHASAVPAFSQSGTSGYLDNALKYNRLLMEKTGEGVYKLVGPYKVIGTSYLFGEKARGDLFTPEAKAFNIYLSYNTYNQEVDFYSSSNPDKALTKEPGSVDSFFISSNAELGLDQPIKFVYGALIGSSDKSYFKEIFSGPRCSVYKKYHSDLGYVSSNYVQSELRQFDLLYDYYYTDNGKKEMGLKKLKSNAISIVKELKEVKDLSTVLTNDAFSVNQEEALRKAFEYINQ
jgi:hypothetical protein